MYYSKNDFYDFFFFIPRYICEILSCLQLFVMRQAGKSTSVLRSFLNPIASTVYFSLNSSICTPRWKLSVIFTSEYYQNSAIHTYRRKWRGHFSCSHSVWTVIIWCSETIQKVVLSATEFKTEGHGGVGQYLAQHEPALCPDSHEGQWHPG